MTFEILNLLAVGSIIGIIILVGLKGINSISRLLEVEQKINDLKIELLNKKIALLEEKKETAQ